MTSDECAEMVDLCGSLTFSTALYEQSSFIRALRLEGVHVDRLPNSINVVSATSLQITIGDQVYTGLKFDRPVVDFTSQATRFPSIRRLPD